MILVLILTIVLAFAAAGCKHKSGSSGGYLGGPRHSTVAVALR